MADNLRQYRVTPVISTTPYSSGDQLGAIQTFTEAAYGAADRSVRLKSLSLIDFGNQGVRIRLHFFSTAPTLTSTDNTPIAITATDARDSWLGYFDITTTDYSDQIMGGVPCKIASFVAVDYDFISNSLNNLKRGDSNIYVVAQTVSTPTYPSTNSLVFIYNFVD